VSSSFGFITIISGLADTELRGSASESGTAAIVTPSTPITPSTESSPHTLYHATEKLRAMATNIEALERENKALEVRAIAAESKLRVTERKSAETARVMDRLEEDRATMELLQEEKWLWGKRGEMLAQRYHELKDKYEKLASQSGKRGAEGVS
jgi:predicted  nucleic acid-binding Zn-ribbon protein